MRQPSMTGRQSELVKTLKQFFDAQSVAPAVTEYCSKCGSPVLYLQTQFWLLGGEQNWNVMLPYCPDCQPMPIAGATYAA
jgi:hypothetical protein